MEKTWHSGQLIASVYSLCVASKASPNSTPVRNPTNRNGGVPSEDVNEWTASLFDPLSVNRLSVFDRGNLIIPVWRLVRLEPPFNRGGGLAVGKMCGRIATLVVLYVLHVLDTR